MRAVISPREVGGEGKFVKSTPGLLASETTGNVIVFILVAVAVATILGFRVQEPEVPCTPICFPVVQPLPLWPVG